MAIFCLCIQNKMRKIEKANWMDGLVRLNVMGFHRSTAQSEYINILFSSLIPSSVFAHTHTHTHTRCRSVEPVHVVEF